MLLFDNYICNCKNNIFKWDLFVFFVVFEKWIDVVRVECFENGGVKFDDVVNVDECNVGEL